MTGEEGTIRVSPISVKVEPHWSALIMHFAKNYARIHMFKG